MDENNKNNSNLNKNNDVYSTPDIGANKNGFRNIIKSNFKYILTVLIFIFVLLITILIFKSNDSEFFNSNSDFVKNYHSGIESNIEFILLNLHNDIDIPDSVSFNSDSVNFISKESTMLLNLKALKDVLAKMGFVYSIVIDSKSFKEADIISWVYRANYNENTNNIIFAEFTVDFSFKNNTVIIRNLELNYQQIKNVELIIPPVKKPDTVVVNLKKDTTKTDSVSIKSDTLKNNQKDTSKNKDGKISIEEKIKEKKDKSDNDILNDENTIREKKDENKNSEKELPSGKDTAR